MVGKPFADQPALCDKGTIGVLLQEHVGLVFILGVAMLAERDFFDDSAKGVDFGDVAIGRLARVVRTAWVEPAIRAQHGSDGVLVGAKRHEQDGFHRRRVASPSASRSVGASAAVASTSPAAQARRSRSTTSNAVIVGRRARIASRNMRLSRFLSMARLRYRLPIT